MRRKDRKVLEQIYRRQFEEEYKDYIYGWKRLSRIACILMAISWLMLIALAVWLIKFDSIYLSEKWIIVIVIVSLVVGFIGLCLEYMVDKSHVSEWRDFRDRCFRELREKAEREQ